MEPGGHNSAKAAIPELSAIETNQSSVFSGIKKPYKNGDALSVMNTAQSCVKSADKINSLSIFLFFKLLLFFQGLEEPVSSHWFLREARGG